MESSLATIIKIAKVSQELIVNLTDASRRGGDGPEISRLLFWLDKIVISSRAILRLLHQCMINSTPDGQLQSWISTNGPIICLLVLNEMRKKTDNVHFNRAFFSVFDPSVASSREKIDEAARVFDTHRKYFDCLLMSDTWNSKVEQLHQVVVATAAVNLHVNAPTIPDLGNFASSGIANMYCNLSEKESRVLVDLKKLEVILRWLDAFRCVDKHVDTLLQRQPNTCTWLLETTAYKAWLAGENPFLWLHGKAGSGKSVLVASTIEHLENTLMDGPLVFFYCDFGTEESTDATQVIRSLLYQLLDQYRRGKIKPGALEIMDELDSEQSKGDTALKNITRLSSLVSHVAEQFRQRPLIIVDALDECKDVDCLLSALLMLKTDGVRLLVSSRPIQAIKHRFHGLPSISMDKMADDVSADIRLHVDKEVDSHLRLALLNPTLKQEVRSILYLKSDGMFRWVQCQLDALKACVTLQELQETLNDLPTGLEATYERILLRIDQRPSEGKISRRALTWLVASSRPLILTEMLEALSIDLQMRKLDERVAPVHKYALLDVLGSLVMYNEETDIINLSHYSVKEYLIGEVTRMKLPAYSINLQEAHKQVFQLCMCYLSASLVSLLDNDGTAQSTEHGSTAILHSIPSLPLLDYVFSCSFDHLAQLKPTDGPILDSMTALQSEIQRRPQEWERMCRTASLYHAYKSWITPEHDFIVCVLISLLPEPFLRAFLNRIPPQTKYKSNPLVHTVRFNKVDHARTLLLRGVDVNSSGCEVANSGSIERTVPLVVALQRENDALVDLFLKEGSAAVPQQVYSTVFLKSHCEYAPHLVTMLLQADEFVEWAAKVKDANIISLPLDHRRYRQRQMSEEDLIVVIRRLAQIGHDFCSEHFLLMVASAISEGHLSLLKYLFLIEAPIPVGILLAEEVAPLIRNLARQGVNTEAIMAKGDIALHRVLERCSGGGPRCWTLDCFLCSKSRSILLVTFGREVERILAKIIMVIQLVQVRMFAKHTNVFQGGNSFLRTARILRPLADIRSTSGTLLQAMNRSVLHGTDLDHHSKRWLSGQGPNVCLKVLQQMENLTETDAPSVSAEEKFNNVTALFEEQRSHFRFLLGTANPDCIKDLADSAMCYIDLDHHSERWLSGQGPNTSLELLEQTEGLDETGAPSVFAEENFNMITPFEEQQIRFQDSTDSAAAEIIPAYKRALSALPLPSPPPPAGVRAFPQMSQSAVTASHRRRRWTRTSYISLSPKEARFVFVGQPGIGKSSLINMTIGIPDHSRAAAHVGRSARSGTLHTACYSFNLMTGRKCELWDTRGLDVLTDGPAIHDIAFQLYRGPRHRTVLVWCIQATMIDVPICWHQLREVHEAFYGGNIRKGPAPMVVVTQVTSDTTGWEAKCRNQIQQLDLRVGLFDFSDSVLLLSVRKHRGASSPEYAEDSKAVRDHIFRLALNPPPLVMNLFEDCTLKTVARQ